MGRLTENERYKVVFLNSIDGLCSIQDTDAEIPTFYNDLSYLCSSTRALCDLLNEKEHLIKEQEKYIKHLEKRIKREK